MSSVSLSGNSSSTSPEKYPAPTLEQIRKTVLGKQQQCYHVKAIKEHKKRVHKRVTELYVKDKKKPRVEDQMSSEAIARQIQKDYDGHGPSARYIRRYVNDYGLFGLSPIGTGTKGTISRWEFDPLCLGLETYI